MSAPLLIIVIHEDGVKPEVFAHRSMGLTAAPLQPPSCAL